MPTRYLWRKIVALTASYVIAVQAALFGLAPSAYALAASSGVLCVNGERSGEVPRHNDAQHDNQCCLAAGCTSFDKLAGAVRTGAALARHAFELVWVSAAHDEPYIWPSERPRS